MTRTITADDIDFGEAASTLVYSDTLRFIVPVQRLAGGGEPLVPPHGEPVGDSFKDSHGRPIRGRGIVFFNPEDGCWQAAPGDGTAVLIISPVSESQGAKLIEHVASRNADPNTLTLDQLKAAIDYAIDELGIRAAYNSTRQFVAERMTPFDPTAAPGFGLHWRKAHDPCHAVYVPGDGAFLGPAASPQTFVGGAVILEQGDDVRLVQRTSFEATYRFPDGRPARVAELAVQDPTP
jgi:hypothetical protein